MTQAKRPGTFHGFRACTPIDNPGPRWSGYLPNPRRRYGLAIEAFHETHGGQFAGNHALYVLHSHVEIISRSNEPKRHAA